MKIEEETRKFKFVYCDCGAQPMARFSSSFTKGKAADYQLNMDCHSCFRSKTYISKDNKNWQLTVDAPSTLFSKEKADEYFEQMEVILGGRK